MRQPTSLAPAPVPLAQIGNENGAPAGSLERARNALQNAVDLDPERDVGRSAQAMREELPAGD